MTAEVATGFVVDHVRGTVQLLPPDAIVHEVEAGVMEPDMTGTDENEAATVQLFVIEPVV